MQEAGYAQLALFAGPALKRCPRCEQMILRSEYGTQSYCRPCHAAYIKARTPRKERQRPSREQILANARARSLRYWRKNGDKYRQYAQDNRERIAARKHEYMRENMDRWRVSNRRRRALKKNPEGTTDYIDPLIVLERDDGACGICGGDVDPVRFDVDHIIPLSRDGEHTFENVQTSHPRCNRQKYNTLPEEH